MADKTKQELEAEAKRTIARNEKDIASWARALKRFLEKNAEKVLKKIQSKEGGYTQLSAAAALGQLEDALNDVGMKDLFDEAAGIYKDVVDQVRAEFIANLGERVVFSRVFAGQIEQFITLKNQQQTKTLLNYVDDVRSVVAEQVLLGQKPDWAEFTEDVTARTVSNLESDFVSEVAAFHRQIQFQAAEDVGAEYFLYAGNIQDNSRPFCRARYGKVFTMKTIRSWDNGQGLPVVPYLGGYRCRHRLVAVRKELAESIGISEL